MTSWSSAQITLLLTMSSSLTGGTLFLWWWRKCLWRCWWGWWCWGQCWWWGGWWCIRPDILVRSTQFSTSTALGSSTWPMRCVFLLLGKNSIQPISHSVIATNLPQSNVYLDIRVLTLTLTFCIWSERTWSIGWLTQLTWSSAAVRSSSWSATSFRFLAPSIHWTGTEIFD